MNKQEQDILRVLYIDPATPGSARERDFHGRNPERPAPMIALTTPSDDPTPNGLYRISGEVLDGRWVYELGE